MKIKDLKVGDYLIFISDDGLGREYKDLNVVVSVEDDSIDVETIESLSGNNQALVGMRFTFFESELSSFSIPTEEDLTYLL